VRSLNSTPNFIGCWQRDYSSVKVVQIAHSLSQAAGGLFVSISHLVRSSIVEGSEVVVVAPKGSESPSELAAWRPAEIRRFWRVGPKKFGYSPGMLGGLLQINPDLIHSHGVWTFTSLAAARWNKRTGKPYVVSIHGMLEPWSLSQSFFKKRFARRLYQDRILNGAACVRATSPMEVESIRSAGVACPIALVPNGVSLPLRPAVDPRSASRTHRQAIFVSRVHPKKGLLNLVAAWARVRPVDWQLKIIGPDEKDHRAQVETAITAARLEDVISFTGPIWGDERFAHYWNADLFILPSFSENFGMVVAEALACEVPVITTRGLPWEKLEEHRCGWWIEIGIDPLADALRNAVSLSDSERRQMGVRGRQLISDHYSWESAAHKMNQVYRWMLGATEPPGAIVFR
jgi:glycosyltransferase involved in cell wall biosynthesis